VAYGSRKKPLDFSGIPDHVTGSNDTPHGRMCLFNGKDVASVSTSRSRGGLETQ